MRILAAHSYLAHRIMAIRIKDPTDIEALQIAAADMAPLIDVPNPVLVPAPSSTGNNPAMLMLAYYVAEALPMRVPVVEAVIRKTPVPSSHVLRRMGLKAVTLEQQIASMARGRRLPPGRSVVIIDNVVTEGRTALAMEAVLDRPVTLVVYADAKRSRRKNPTTLRVCICGSRGFRSLTRVSEVISTLPEGTVVVHGGARGVDVWAGEAAAARGLPVDVVQARWRELGRAAGPERNRWMIASCDVVYAFWDGESPGTRHAIDVAKRLGKELEVVMEDDWRVPFRTRSP